MHLGVCMISMIQYDTFNWYTIELFELLVFNLSHVHFLRNNNIFQNMQLVVIIVNSNINLRLT